MKTTVNHDKLKNSCLQGKAEHRYATGSSGHRSETLLRFGGVCGPRLGPADHRSGGGCSSHGNTACRRIPHPASGRGSVTFEALSALRGSGILDIDAYLGIPRRNKAKTRAPAIKREPLCDHKRKKLSCGSSGPALPASPRTAAVLHPWNGRCS